MSDHIKITFRKPKYGSTERSVLYVNGENLGYLTFEEENELKNKIYKVIDKFSQKQKTLKTMRNSK